MPRPNNSVGKDMYWFAHGCAESMNQRPPDGEEEQNETQTLRVTAERRSPSEDCRDGSNSSGPSSLDDRLHVIERRFAVEERRKQLLEAEKERNEAMLKKHMERDATLEAKRNAQRSTISFAFGSSVPRNVESFNTHLGNGEPEPLSRMHQSVGLTQKEENHNTLWERRSVSPIHSYGHVFHSERPDSAHSLSSHYDRRIVSPPPCWLVGSGALVGEDIMSKSMSASIPAPRGRRKNDLMPTVPYERTILPRSATTTSVTRKRSVSMTRLDQLAMPRKHYVEATKACANKNKENVRSPTRPLSSASDHSGACLNKALSTVTRRVQTSPRKPRPVSIAGTYPDRKTPKTPTEVRISPVKRSYTPIKKTSEAAGELKKTPTSASHTSTPKSMNKSKQTLRPASTPKITTTKATPTKTQTPRSTKSAESKLTASKTPSPSKTPPMKASTPKTSKSETEAIATPADVEAKLMEAYEAPDISSSDLDIQAENDKNNAKRIISEEEAKTALAEKRRLAREQAEKEAELEKQRQEEMQRAEEERLRLEEEERKHQEELMIEHRRQEEEKLQRAIQEQQQKEEEERTRREEEQRIKNEQEKKAKEEAEKQRIELEEKLRKEEEERAERKKRLEKIMSRTRGKSNQTSPSGSISGSDQLDSSENPQDDFSSEANSLDSKEGGDPKEGFEVDDKSEADNTEANPTYEVVSEGESLNSNDLMMPLSETASQENSLVIHQIETNDVKQDLVKEETESTLNQHIENELNVHKSLNVHAPEFTPVGFENFGSNAPEETTFPSKEAHSENAPFYYEDPDIDKKIASVEQEIAQVATESDVNLQFKRDFSSSETEYKSDMAHEDYEPHCNIDQNLVEDTTSIHMSNFQLPDPEMYVPDSIPRSSVSSDIKLPDPIYETSEDGSVSSEQFHHDFKTDDIAYSKVTESSGTQDEVFSEQIATRDEGVQQLNPFEQLDIAENVIAAQDPVAMDANPFGNYSEQTPFDMSAGFYIEPSSNSQFEENGDEVLSLSRSSVSSVVEKDIPVSSDASNAVKEELSHFSCNDEFLTGESEILNNKENPFESNTTQFVQDEFASGANPFSTTSSSDKTSNLQPDFVSRHQYEQIEFLDNQTDNQTDLGNITLIKASDADSCIGIISSVDHDLASNDFPRASLNNEQLRTNFEYTSVTDSEDSSLDSNLSQVEGGKRDQDLNGESVHEIDSSRVAIKNGGNYFEDGMVENFNGSSKTNGNHFYASETVTNGHRMDHLDSGLEGANILTVDSTGGDLFENEDAIEFGKGTNDPFLVKGASKQNPFLGQEDQKHVLVTPDFLN